MKRRLQRLYWLGVGITLMMAIIAMFILTVMRINDTRETLYDMLETATAWTQETGVSLQQQADEIAEAAPPIRVTFLMDHGLVLADSQQDAMTMQSHADRAEVVRAMQDGVGESLRLSDTQNNFVLYVARKIAPNLILRLSYPMAEIFRLLTAYGIGITVLFLVLFLIQRWVLAGFSSAMLRQMEDVRCLLQGETERKKAVFPELQPEINNIAYLAERLNGDLEEVNRTMRLRSDFVANASHEIRSPLTSIMGFAEMLDEGLADTPEEQELCIKTIRSECQRMLDVVNDILQLSRAERQKDVEKQLVQVDSVSQEVLKALSPQAAQKQITLQQTGSMTLHAVEKDVWEILYNLVDNAIRYGRQGGQVLVSMADRCLTVEDDGVGIDKKHLPRIFEQFYRVDESRDASVRGTGLGLSIVRALTERNGGSIHVESEVGQGSRMIIRFGGEGGAHEA